MSGYYFCNRSDYHTSKQFDLEEFLDTCRIFSRDTFGPGARFKAVTEHIRKEVNEVEADPYDLKEWCDVIILAFDGAMRAGYSPKEIVDAWIKKHNENTSRKWPDWRTAPTDKPIEHVRD